MTSNPRADAMAAVPRRIRVVGVSGSGKSHLAARISSALHRPRLELDAVFWAAGWTYRDLDEARGFVRDFAAAHPDGWVIDGNWTSRLDGLLEPGQPGGADVPGADVPGADVILWLDHSRATVMRRILARTVRRAITREDLWHGNRERASSWLRLDPERNILLWAWTQHPVVRRRMSARIAAGEPIVRLRGQRAADEWLARVAAARDDAAAAEGAPTC